MQASAARSLSRVEGIVSNRRVTIGFAVACDLPCMSVRRMTGVGSATAPSSHKYEHYSYHPSNGAHRQSCPSMQLTVCLPQFASTRFVRRYREESQVPSHQYYEAARYYMMMLS
ncbi:hypothetical protein HAX54_013116 [Datura stramonium]|uniref:Uncharacterized protein n=1 Tax=Datura stramonium TaxID=4076 RepID=A0ABS8TMN3_DATST|nr:hypothetical protein [Datura stramonium]